MSIEVRVIKPNGIVFEPNIERMVGVQLTSAGLSHADKGRIPKDTVSAVATVNAVSGNKVIYYSVAYLDPNGRETARSTLLPKYFLRKEQLPPRLREIYIGPE